MWAVTRIRICIYKINSRRSRGAQRKSVWDFFFFLGGGKGGWLVKRKREREEEEEEEKQEEQEQECQIGRAGTKADRIAFQTFCISV